MRSLRRYGNPPFRVAVIHGGPGAPGEMAPVARGLSLTRGVLEPLQTAASVEGQVLELKTVLEENGSLPVTLIGWSWGAILSFILAAENPSIAAKLILVGSAPFAEEYATNIMAIRLSRLGEEERREAATFMEAFDDPAIGDKSAPFARLGQLFTGADSYDPLTLDTEALACQHDVYQSVWTEARERRASGKLLELAKKIRCPVVAIHGDFDPHPAAGVREPLSQAVADFRFCLLRKCGHLPWIERQARDEFFDILEQELRQT